MSASAPSRPPVSLRVLVVEDDDDWRDTLGEYLELLGCECHASAGADDAVRSAAERPPALAFVDLGLRGVNGNDVARRLRAVPGCGETKIVALTGFGDSATRASAAAAGFDEFLVKPLGADRLEALVRSLWPSA
jgi:CheY-like chemotaxis protein